MNKPFSQACENNKAPILSVISDYFCSGTILEIGSGTGQHAVHFAKHLRQVFWQTSDQDHYHDGMKLWLAEYQGDNLGQPFELDVNQPWPITQADGVFSANTAHIMSWGAVQNMFKGVSDILESSGFFCLYGPININGAFTSASNEAFDLSLRSRDPDMGIRNLEDLQTLAESHALEFINLHPMPANNVIMVWQKV